MTDHRTAWRWALGGFALGALVLLVAAVADEADGTPAPAPEAFAVVLEGRDLRVQGEGFLPGEEVYTGVCIKRDGQRRQCHAPTPHHTTADADGAIDTTFTPEPFDGFAGVEDCRGHHCWVFVEGTSLPSLDDTIRAPFALDP